MTEKKRRYRAGLTKLNASIKVETKIWLLAQPEGAGAAIDRLVEKEVDAKTNSHLSQAKLYDCLGII